MQHSSASVSPIEKIISIFSYFTMGFAGLIFVIFAYIIKKKVRYFLMYNIAQSMLISIILAIFSYLFDIILKIISSIPFLAVFASNLILFFSKKLIILPFGFSYNIFQSLIFILLIYISVGIIIGRIFYIPVLTNLMNKAMKSYN